jgi:hypothetical protein
MVFAQWPANATRTPNSQVLNVKSSNSLFFWAFWGAAGAATEAA